MNISEIDAVILAGGRGTRISHLFPDIPKPMIRVNGRPFIEWVIMWLVKHGIKRVVISTGYLHAVIKDFIEGLSDKYDIELLISREDEALGTGGAVRHACRRVRSNDIIVLNGDSLCLFDLREFVGAFLMGEYEYGVSAVLVKDVSRFGTVCCCNGEISCFHEKTGFHEKGFINSGVYCMNVQAVSNFDRKKFSIENDLLPENVSKNNVLCHQFKAQFIDIGTPDSIECADEFFHKNRGIL